LKHSITDNDKDESRNDKAEAKSTEGALSPLYIQQVVQDSHDKHGETAADSDDYL
jgi:hypothetical protein